MIDFIIKYWLEFLFTIMTSTIIYMFNEYKGLKQGLIALLRNEIVRIYEKYVMLGYCPSYMKENVNAIYTNYHALGGNGYATSMINELYKLPNELKEDDRIEQNTK